jgi:hypothetical protein
MSRETQTRVLHGERRQTSVLPSLDRQWSPLVTEAIENIQIIVDDRERLSGGSGGHWIEDGCRERRCSQLKDLRIS